VLSLRLTDSPAISVAVLLLGTRGSWLPHWEECDRGVLTLLLNVGLSDVGVWFAIQEGCYLSFQTANMFPCAKNAALRAM